MNHTYTHGGTYTATVTASDGRGGTDTAEIPIVVGNPAGNQAPTVTAAADPKTGTAPLTVEFSSHAIDPDGDDLLVTWAFGDGGQAAGDEATHTYTSAGTYTATVTAMDPTGATGTATVQVVVSAPPTQQPQVEQRHRRWDGRCRSGPEAGGVVRRQQAGLDDARRQFSRRGLSVRVTCTEAMSGTAKLTVSSSDAQGAEAQVEHAGHGRGPVHRRRQPGGRAEGHQGRQARTRRVEALGEGHADRATAVGWGAGHAEHPHAHAQAPLGARRRPALVRAGRHSIGGRSGQPAAARGSR